MNIDDLTTKIRKISSEKNVQNLADLILKWKTDEKNVVELNESIERYFGNAWIDKKANFEKVYEIWSDFKSCAINGIGGMTMNERIYMFGLFEQFDNSIKNPEKEKIYSKLMAEK